MGLELIPSGSDEEGTLHLLIQFLVASGKEAGVKTTVRFSQNTLDGLPRALRQRDSAVQDPLLAVILKAESTDVQGFLESLRRQRAL